MAIFTVRFRYMPHMKLSITAAMTAPISSAIQVRVWLYQTWSRANVLRYISPNMIIVEAAIIAAKRP